MSTVAAFARRRRRNALVPYTPRATALQWIDGPPTLNAIGATANSRAIVVDQRGAAFAGGPAVTYASGTPANATVNSSTGLVTAVANGTSVITASATGLTSITQTATVSQTVASITGVSSTLSTDDSSSGTFTPVGKDANNNTVSGATFAYAVDYASILSVNATTGAWAGQSVGTAHVTITASPGGATFVVTATVTHATTTYATPVLKDDMGYVTLPAFLANVQSSGGGSGSASALYASASVGSSTGVAQLVPDRASEALYNGFATLRYDFLPTTSHDTGVDFAYNLPNGGANTIWWRLRIKFKPGFSTAGIAAAGNAQAYKLHEYVFAGAHLYGSGRLEITNTTQYDNYFTYYYDPVNSGGTVTCNAGAATFSVAQTGLQNGDTISIDGGTTFPYTVSAFDGATSCTLSGSPTFSATSFKIHARTLASPNTPQGNIANEWNGTDWYDYIACSAVSADKKTRTVKWWRCIDGQTPALISTVSGAASDGSDAPLINQIVHGANFNQARNTTVSLWRGPWDVYDATIYANPYGVPSADISDIASTLGVDASIARLVTAPSAPGVPSPSNAASSTTSSLTFPVTLNASGGLPTALLVQYSTDGGTTWTPGADIGLIAPTLGGSVNAQVIGLPRNTPGIQVQFKEYNAGGTSVWSSTVTGTTPNVDTLPVTSGLVLQLEADTNVVSSSGAVSQITDSSATGVVVTQATGTAQPTVRAGASPTGLPGIDLASGKYLVATKYQPELATSTKTVFTVFTASSALSTSRHIWSNMSDANHGYAAYISEQSSADGPGYIYGYGTGASGASTQPGRAGYPRDFELEAGLTGTSKWGATWDGGTFSGSADVFAPNTSVPVALGTASYSVGTGTGPATWYATYEFNRVLTTAEVASMVSFIRQKWGTP